VKKIQKAQNTQNAQNRKPKLALALEHIRVLTDLSHVAGGSSTDVCSEHVINCTGHTH
jgi:hypothetical protein